MDKSMYVRFVSFSETSQNCMCIVIGLMPGLMPFLNTDDTNTSAFNFFFFAKVKFVIHTWSLECVLLNSICSLSMKVCQSQSRFIVQLKGCG